MTTTHSDLDATKIANVDQNPSSNAEVTFLCQKCRTANTETQLARKGYRCFRCGFELAHIDVTPTGSVRGIFGWLRQVGDTIQDRYRVKTVLGRGGFAATYLVEDLRLGGKPRAIKEIPELYFDQHETDLLSRLNHPAIPDITDRSSADGMVYLVLKFGGNRTLDDERKIRDGTIPLDELMPWTRQLCDVLHYLHSQQPSIIHRDLKPGNILLDDQNRIMLIDFGIAKESSPTQETRTLARAATHGFSPPEQVLGTGTDERSDIYSLAATLYSVLTGTVPPAAHERVAGTELVPPTAMVSGLSPAIEQALLRALDLNVNRRQQSVHEFLRDFSGKDDGVVSKPKRGRTVLLTEQKMESVKAKPAVKLRTVDLRHAGTAAKKKAKKKSKPGVFTAVAAIFVASIAVGGIWLFNNQRTEKIDKPNQDHSASQSDALPKPTILEEPDPDHLPVKPAPRNPLPQPVVATKEIQPGAPPPKKTSALEAFNKRREQVIDKPSLPTRPEEPRKDQIREKPPVEPKKQTVVKLDPVRPKPIPRKKGTVKPKPIPKSIPKAEPKQDDSWLDDLEMNWK